jgi:YgiT-type zinc finger domain-containing protein
MKCPCCGAAELIHDARDIPYVYKGETTIIPAVTGDFRPACAKVVLDRERRPLQRIDWNVSTAGQRLPMFDPALIENHCSTLFIQGQCTGVKWN